MKHLQRVQPSTTVTAVSNSAAVGAVIQRHASNIARHLARLQVLLAYRLCAAANQVVSKALQYQLANEPATGVMTLVSSVLPVWAWQLQSGHWQRE
jgi:hypothetical protein